MTSVTTSRLSDLETVIERGLATYVEVGDALMEIHDSRLYRETHGTFEDYCRERWGWSRITAYRHIEAAQVVAALPTGNTPANEAQARELAPLLDDPDAMAAAWGRAQDIASDAPPTAADVRQAVRGTEEEVPIDAEMWRTLRGVLEALAAFAANDAAQIAATVPDRNRAATARRLRRLGTYLGRIAWLLEGKESHS